MILSDIKKYLIYHKHASLNDIANNFKSNEDAIEAMMNIWVDKGKVKISKSSSERQEDQDNGLDKDENLNEGLTHSFGEDVVLSSSYETEENCVDKFCNGCSAQSFCSSTHDFLIDDGIKDNQIIYEWIG